MRSGLALTVVYVRDMPRAIGTYVNSRSRIRIGRSNVISQPFALLLIKLPLLLEQASLQHATEFSLDKHASTNFVYYSEGR